MEKEAQIDLAEDLEELTYLYNSYINKLVDFQKSLKKIRRLPSFNFVNSQVNFYLKSLRALKKKLPVIKTFKDKDIFFDNLRTQVGLIGALITSTDWQSPSYTHSRTSQAGVQEGKILANINDYKRDRHLNETKYQSDFIKEYVNGLKILPIHCLLTTSGMAALTTILTFLTLYKKIAGPIMIGKSIYFENTEMIKKFFQDEKVLEVDEMQTDQILAIFNKQKPEVLFFDSLCNAATVAVPDIKKILEHVAKNIQKETYFIIDNSTLSIAIQPLDKFRFNNKLKLIVFESLNKYHQFGMDRVTGGIVWTHGFGFEDFNFARVHSGTNIIDSSCYVLPEPNKNFLKKRLLRFQRNAEILTSAVQNFLAESKSKKIAKVIYPGLENHPSYPWSKNYFFQGSYFILEFHKKHQKIKTYQNFVKMVIKVAKKRKVSINGGTSFGFNTTRIYLTAKDTKFGEPFIRVSVGTENILEIQKIKDVFIEAINLF